MRTRCKPRSERKDPVDLTCRDARTLPINAIVFNHPKHSSMRFLLFLAEGIALLACRALSMALPPLRPGFAPRVVSPNVPALAYEVPSVEALVATHRHPPASRSFSSISSAHSAPPIPWLPTPDYPRSIRAILHQQFPL